MIYREELTLAPGHVFTAWASGPCLKEVRQHVEEKDLVPRRMSVASRAREAANFSGRRWLNSLAAGRRWRLRSRRRRRRYASGWLCRRGSLQALLQKLLAAGKQFLFRNLTSIDVRQD